jgi:hypothetical protein
MVLVEHYIDFENKVMLDMLNEDWLALTVWKNHRLTFADLSTIPKRISKSKFELFKFIKRIFIQSSQFRVF